jgi:hypothetical protein
MGYLSAVVAMQVGQQVEYVGKRSPDPPKPGELGWVFEIGEPK